MNPVPPILPERAIATQTGLAQLAGIVDGTYPQAAMADTLSFRLVEVADGRAVVHGTVSERFLNPLGIVHGGWASTLLDTALGCAVHATLAAGERFATLQLNVHLTRAITTHTPRLVATGTVVSRGRRAATSEAHLTDDAGVVYGHATSVCLITR